MSFEQKVLYEIQEKGLIRKNDSVLAGVSGGVDSVCLLLLLERLRGMMDLTVTVLHIEHGIRGKESMEDAGWVEGLCGSLLIPCRIFHADIPKLAAAKGLGAEEAARIYRYEIFEQCAREEEAAGRNCRIAVAHNGDDQAETVLLNLCRGSGLRGLGGMRELRGRVIRPLLSYSRTQIETYVRERGYSWREDRTNLSDDYTRNRIRHKVLPMLAQTVNARSAAHIREAAALVREADDYICRQANEAARRCMRTETGRVTIDVTAFRQEERLLREMVVRQALRSLKGGEGLKDFGRGHIEDVIALAEKGSGKRLDLPGRVKAVREKKRLFLYSEEE